MTVFCGRRYRFFISVLVLVCLFSQQGKAQSERERGLPFITNYTDKDFKFSPQIWSVIEDDRGVMYFGVQGTLLEYDGVEWRKVKLDTLTLPVVRAMAKDKNGRVYFGSYDGLGYLEVDDKGQTVTRSLTHLLPKDQRNFFDVWSVRAGDDGIYFQTRESLIRIRGDKEVKIWRAKTAFGHSFYLNGSLFISERDKGVFKLVDDELVLLPGTEGVAKLGINIMLPRGKAANGKDEYFFITFYDGAYTYDGVKASFMRTELQEKNEGVFMYRGIQLPDSNYAIASAGGGLIIIDRDGKIIEQFTKDLGLQDESVYNLWLSKRGILWMALDNGISRLAINSPITQFNDKAGIKSSMLTVARFEGRLYAGSSTGLLVFDNKSRVFRQVEGIPIRQIFNLVPDGNRLLVPGVGVHEVRNGRVRSIAPGVTGTMVNILPSKKYKDLYYGAAHFGVAVMRPDKNGLFQALDTVPGLKDQIWSFHENADGSLWAGTQSGFVYLVQPVVNENGEPVLEKFSFKKYGPEHGYRNGLGQVNSFRGEARFMADSAFYYFDAKAGRFSMDTLLGFFPNGGGLTEGDITNDGAKRHWVRIGKETILVTEGDDGKLILDRNHLLPINDKYFSRILQDQDSIVWVTATDGIFRYDEKLNKSLDQSYAIVLRQVKWGNSPYAASLSQGKKPEMPHGNNALRFEYAAPFFDQEEKTLYQTWLEGFEESWSGWGSNHYKEYTNLPEGNYTFRVRAKNIHGKVSDEIVYAFHVLPPWYRTWWAYLMYTLLIGGGIYVLVRYRTGQLKAKQKELELQVTERTKELSHRVEELAMINSVQEGLVRELDMQAIYDLVGEKIREVFDAKVMDIVTYDSTTGMIEDKYSYEKGDRTKVPPRVISGFRKHVVDTRQPFVIRDNAEELSKKYGNQVFFGDMVRSAVFVPMIAGDKVTGVISLQDTEEEQAFDGSDVSLLTTLANSMSVALQNAKLFEETRQLLAETERGKKNVELLSDIGKKITSSLDLETIFKNLYEHINQLADATVFGVGIYNPEKEQLEYSYAVERGQRYEPYTRSTVDKNQFPVWCIDNRKAVFINDVESEAANYISAYEHHGVKLEDGSVAQAPESLIYLPLVAKEKVLGIISIQSFRKHAYTPYHLNLLQNLATYTSIALDNATAYQKLNESEHEIAQRMAEISSVNSISQALAGQIELDQLINLVGEQMKDLFHANIVYLALLDKKTRIIGFPYQFGDNLQPMKLGEGLTSKILLTGKSLLINKEVGASTEALGVSRLGVPAASYLGVPIPVGDEVIGVLSVQTTEQENRFNERDERLLTTIAANVGVAIRKARLFEEVKQAQHEADNARKTAEQANAAKSAFLSTVSHELRTPLTSVLGFAKIIKKRLEEKIFPLTDTTDPKTAKTIEQVAENLNVVVSEGQRLTHLINDVLDLAKIEAGKMEWNMDATSMQEVVERAIAATTALFDQKSLKLDLKVEEDLPEINGDRDKLIQVVVNLLSNAVKFTDQGSVTCRIYRDPIRDEVVMSVTDTGIGIAEKDHAAVFEQFKQVGDTLTDKPKGTGLGLPICKEIVEHHGGRIWLESAIGKGSTFSFSIPLTREELGRPIHLTDLVRQLKEQMQQSELNFKGTNATILVVDDDDSIRSLLRQELGDAGYLVKEATNGKEALALVREVKPDLIILDIMMPEMNGFDVAAILKNDPQTMDIPIIVLSIVQDKARGMRVGVDRYLTKPIDTGQLFTDVGNLLVQGKSRKRVMVVDEDQVTIRTLSDVLEAKGYQVVESDGRELVEKAIETKPDIIILNSVLSGKQHIVQSLRFEKGLENVLFLIYQ